MKSFTKFFMVVGLLGLMITSCVDQIEEQRWKNYQAKQEKDRADSITKAKFKGFRVIEIDSCEYLINGFGYMSHKGNCKFCEERRKQEKTERENRE